MVTAWLDDAGADLAQFGGKGASLATLRRAGQRVPPGFCLLAPAYWSFIDHNSLAPLIADLLATPALHLPKVAREAAAPLAERLARAELPPAVDGAVQAAYTQLQERAHVPLVVAARSSALSEDGAGASSAGLYETFLNLRSVEAVCDAIVRCYRSLWTPRAVQYRAFKKLDSAREAMAVVVMELVQAETAGVAFTVNPVTGDRDAIMVNASWGLGEAIVSGRVTPDQFLLAKSDLRVVSREIQPKELEILPDPSGASGVIHRPVAGERAHAPALSDQQLTVLGAACLDIEKLYGRPMDVEWAFVGGDLYILQARPVTGLA